MHKELGDRPYMKRPDLLAHSAPRPGAKPQPYEEHIGNVLKGARAHAKAMLRFASPNLHCLSDGIEAAAVFHDLGKLDADTQAKLGQERKAKLCWDHVDAGVAHLSNASNWMAAWLVRAHHPPGLPEYSVHFDKDGLGRKLRGRRNDEDKRQAAQIAHTNIHLPGYLVDHESAIDVLQITPMKPVHGLAMRLALSCLVDADHADTARFDSGRLPAVPPKPRWEARLDHLNQYVSDLPSSGSANRDHHRGQFYATCRDSGLAYPLVACEGPVGIGKTTAVTAYLLKRAASANLRRIIIVAPYTNIISQTVTTLRAGLVLEDENPEEVVVEHHHKADFSSIDARELAVLWSAPIVVTTAVQFFETLGSNHPGQLRKLHALPGSAIFVDEAHAALPAHLWRQSWRWIRELADHWNCRFVFASGSLARFWENPDIVEEPECIPELLPSELKQQILAVERRRIRYLNAGHFESVSPLIEVVCKTDGPRLVIFNTVQSAAVFARAMRRAGHDVLHLSTALAPKDRSAILAGVAARLRQRCDNRWTLIATSCVEAGVDLSFSTAFRERFSTASIIQVGGRVNRHGAPEARLVFDFTIDAGFGITSHPGARYSASVLKRQFAAGLFEKDGYDPAEIVTRAMAEEIKDRGGLGRDPLVEAERSRDYPLSCEAMRVIDTDTRLVVVDSNLAVRLEQRLPVGFSELLRGSVQIWARKIELLDLKTLPGRQEIYHWPYAYDAAFLGYMAGVLDQLDLSQEGFAIV
jgi:CRISPR-associated endonuclease/helicase Cas3